MNALEGAALSILASVDSTAIDEKRDHESSKDDTALVIAEITKLQARLEVIREVLAAATATLTELKRTKAEDAVAIREIKIREVEDRVKCCTPTRYVPPSLRAAD